MFLEHCIIFPFILALCFFFSSGSELLTLLLLGKVFFGVYGLLFC